MKSQDNGGTDTTMRAGDTEARTALNKFPAVTTAFWIIKIMSTTVGETGADYLAVHVGLGTIVWPAAGLMDAELS